MTIELTSPAFKNGELIPVECTCEGKDISPLLKWENVPDDTGSFALVCDDPDAPGGTWVHWVIYDIPAYASELREGIPVSEFTPSGAKQGTNGFQLLGYGGPCPPPGDAHRYFFRLYAVDLEATLGPGATREELFQALDGHVLDEGELMGRYQRK